MNTIQKDRELWRFLKIRQKLHRYDKITRIFTQLLYSIEITLYTKIHYNIVKSTHELMFLSVRINVFAYCEMLKLRRTAIKQKLGGKRSRKVVLLRDNTRPYSAVWHGSCYINFSGKNRNIQRIVWTFCHMISMCLVEWRKMWLKNISTRRRRQKRGE